jgi:hypothetical protein
VQALPSSISSWPVELEWTIDTGGKAPFEAGPSEAAECGWGFVRAGADTAEASRKRRFPE